MRIHILYTYLVVSTYLLSSTYFYFLDENVSDFTNVSLITRNIELKETFF